jgi:hypothetical protein
VVGWLISRKEKFTMPNLMMFGYDEPSARRLKEKIDPVMQKLGFGEDAVTTIISATVEFCDGHCTPGPYIRVCSTASSAITRIIEALENAGVNEDVEWLIIDGFKSKKTDT